MDFDMNTIYYIRRTLILLAIVSLIGIAVMFIVGYVLGYLHGMEAGEDAVINALKTNITCIDECMKLT